MRTIARKTRSCRGRLLVVDNDLVQRSVIGKIAARIGFDAIKRLGVRDDANLPGAFGGRRKNVLRDVDLRRIEWTWRVDFVHAFALTGYNPTLRDGISANFHGVCQRV